MNQQVLVEFVGGRTVEGVLRGFDRTLNVILDEAVEHIDAPDKPAGSTRKLGFVIARGSNVTLVTPAAERKAIDNPF